MAMTHNELNGGAANAMNKPIFMKSATPLTKSALDAIEKLEGKEGVKKASYQNLRRMLDSAITAQIKSASSRDYAYVWLKDFDTTTAVFDYEEVLYAVDYSVSDTGMVTLSGEVKEVIQQDVYVTDDGKSLVLKYKDSSESGEIITKGVNPDNEGKTTMSKDLQDQIAVLEKAALEQEAKTQELIKQALDNQAKEVEKAALVKSTTELVKGFESVAEADQEALVKSLVTLADESVLVIKALSDMQEAVVKAKAETAEVQKSADALKAEFASSEDEGVASKAGETITKGLSMKEAVAKAKARSNS